MRYLFVGFLFFQLFSVFCQKLHFEKEKLDFSMSESEFKLEGFYCFKNHSTDTIRQFLLYPFPQSQGLGEILSISVNAQYPRYDTMILANFNQKAASFKLMIYPNDSAIIHVIYIQSVPNCKAEYVLTSTKAWNQPLEQADFTLTIPFNSRVDSLSYDADSLLLSVESAVYKWHFREFMPNRNFFVSFSKIEKSKK